MFSATEELLPTCRTKAHWKKSMSVLIKAGCISYTCFFEIEMYEPPHIGYMLTLLLASSFLVRVQLKVIFNAYHVIQITPFCLLSLAYS